MLVLTRRRGETIVIDGKIYVTVVSFGNQKAKLGIVAPNDIAVKRKESVAIVMEGDTPEIIDSGNHLRPKQRNL